MNVYDSVQALLTPRETREQIIEYYQKKYKGDRWKSELVNDLLPIANISKPSLMRRFQGGREKSKLTAKAKREYRELGDSLPPIAPKGYRVEAGSIIWIQYSEECVRRVLKEDIEIRSHAARNFTVTADSNIIANLYNKRKWNDKDGYPACEPKEESSSWDVKITAIK